MPLLTVSILVVLDFPFGLQGLARRARGLFRFNPCCVGFSFWTAMDAINAILELRFQSLLCWIFLLDGVNLVVKEGTSSFNPCCVGFSFWTAKDS